MKSSHLLTERSPEMTSMTAADNTLYTFTISHYSEKVRWTLDHLKLPYHEICLTPVFHIGPTLKMGGRKQTTVPILVTAEASIQDSARILEWLHSHHGPLDIIPAEHQEEVIGAEARFNRIGRDVAPLHVRLELWQGR